MRGMISGFVAVFLLSVLSVCAQVGDKTKATDTPPKGDPRVKALLDKAGLKYRVDEDGDYQVGYKFDDGRSHVAFVFSQTSRLGDMEIREVGAVAYTADEVPCSVARNLLRSTSKVKLGAWELGRFNKQEAAWFRAKIAADTDVETLIMTLRAVSETADEKEKELTDRDDF